MDCVVGSASLVAGVVVWEDWRPLAWRSLALSTVRLVMIVVNSVSLARRRDTAWLVLSRLISGVMVDGGGGA